jgi:hypothetical protein
MRHSGTRLAEQGVIDAATGSPTDSQPKQTLTQRFACAKAARSQTLNSSRAFGLRAVWRR